MNISDLFSWPSLRNSAVDTKPADKQEPVDTSSKFIIEVLRRCLPISAGKASIKGLQARMTIVDGAEKLIQAILRVDEAYAKAIAKADAEAPVIESAIEHAMAVVESSRNRLAELDKADAPKAGK
jgi:hypothetical protein